MDYHELGISPSLMELLFRDDLDEELNIGLYQSQLDIQNEFSTEYYKDDSDMDDEKTLIARE